MSNDELIDKLVELLAFCYNDDQEEAIMDAITKLSSCGSGACSISE